MKADSFIVLLYHGVDSGEAFYRDMTSRQREYILKKALFERHMEYLHEKGFNVMKLDDCLMGAKDGVLPKDTVVLTFDDGEESCFKTIAPILGRFNFKGEFFITTDLIGKPGYMTAEDIRNMASSGHGVQSHSVSHPFLARHTDKKISEELKLSKDGISAVSGIDVEFFSIPTGSYDKRVVDTAKKAGYKAILSSVEGYNNPGGDLYLLKRFAMRSYTGLAALKDICENVTLTNRRLLTKRMVTTPLKCVLTFELYNRIRDRIISASNNRGG
jgi:peptidoglycan/xylan/chitin deacetylase (PgdA/CDA1 family)